MVRFKVTPSVRASAAPTGSGMKLRVCVQRKKVKGGVTRCAKFRPVRKSGKKHKPHSR